MFTSSKKKGVQSDGDKGSTLPHYDRNSKDAVTPNEIHHVEQELIRKMGHVKAERIMEGLRANMDSDGRFGGRNVSRKEIDAMLKDMSKHHFSGMSSHDIKTAGETLNEFE